MTGNSWFYLSHLPRSNPIHFYKRLSVPTGRSSSLGEPISSAHRIEPWGIFLFIFAAIGLALCFHLWSTKQTVRGIEIARLLDVSRYVAENMTRQLNGLNEALTRLSNDYRATALASSGDDASRQLSLLSDTIQSVRGIAIYDGNGNAVASDKLDEVGRDFFAKEFFSSIRNDPHADVLYLSRRTATEDQPAALYLSRAIFDTNGQFSGVVSANLDEEFFAFVVRSGLSASDMRATLAYPDGEIFVTVPAMRTRRRVNVLTSGSAFEKHVRGKAVQTVYEGVVAVTGQDRLLVLNSISPANLVLNRDIIFTVSRDRAEVYSPWYRQLRLYGISYLAVLIPTGILLFIGRRRRRAFLAQEQLAQAAIKLGATRLELALEGAQLGLWELIVDARQLQLDARGAQMLGYGPREVVRSTQEWTDTLHPADQKANMELFAAHLGGEAASYENEFRVRLPDGAYIWLFSKGKVTERAASGMPTRVIGTFMDVTARKLNEAKLADAVLLQKRSGEIARVGGWTLDVISGTSHWTDEVYRIHELEVGSPLALSTALDFYTKDSKPIISDAVAKCMGEGSPWDLELQIVSAKGRHLWVRAQGEAILEDGAIVRLAGAVQDITTRKQASLELERLNATLSELSYKDALTGLGNRRMFDDTLAAEWSRHARQGIPLALLMIDIDYFKLFNDNRGHLEGDECLRQVASVLNQSLWRTHERAMRYGGEEFAILLPETSLDGSMLVAQRILEANKAAQIGHGFSPISSCMTVSIGAAALVPSADQKMTTLTRAADMSLYEAKGQGRARVAVVSEALQGMCPAMPS